MKYQNVIFTNVPAQYLAHNEGLEEVEAENPNTLDTIEHQPVAVSLIISAVFLLAIFTLVGLFKLKLTIRLAILNVLTILLALFYLPHDKTVAIILFVAGGVLALYLVYSLFMVKSKKSSAQDSEKQEK